jgi:hypothetical protein
MNEEERITLDKLVKQYDCEETTDLVRKLKHSVKIRESLDKIIRLKTTEDEETFKSKAHIEGNFLYEKYTNIFNKLVDDELNLEIFERFIVMLEKIENGELDQHEASYKIGMLLKDIYIDKKLNLDDENSEDKYIQPVNNLSWTDYKKMNAKSKKRKSKGGNNKKKHRR